MRAGVQATDEELLTSGDPAAFGLFYARRVREVLARLAPLSRAGVQGGGLASYGGR